MMCRKPTNNKLLRKVKGRKDIVINFTNKNMFKDKFAETSGDF